MRLYKGKTFFPLDGGGQSDPPPPTPFFLGPINFDSNPTLGTPPKPMRRARFFTNPIFCGFFPMFKNRKKQPPQLFSEIEISKKKEFFLKCFFFKNPAPCLAPRLWFLIFPGGVFFVSFLKIQKTVFPHRF